MRDVVFDILQKMLAHSPEASYKRLNPALRSTLGDCICADLPFKRNTFSRIYNELRGHWWFGDGAGSTIGEHYYSLACDNNHASAQQSFEQFAERPGVLLEENTKTAERLHVGSEFQWRGYHVKVTSLRKDRLVACVYGDYPREVEGIRVGAQIGHSKPCYIVTASKRQGNATLLRVIPADPQRWDRQVTRRFVIKYTELATFRREAAKKLKALVGKIAKCDPDKDRVKIIKQVNGANLRHWELEAITAAFQARREWVAKAGVIDKWRAGAGGAWIDVKLTLIRVNGDRVECSNGNHVSRTGAARLLPILLDRRKVKTTLNLSLDGHTVDRVGPNGVRIGCTLVPWSEVELIKPELEKPYERKAVVQAEESPDQDTE